MAFKAIAKVIRLRMFIFPNPVIDIINVTLSIKKPSQVSVGISDLTGRMISNENYTITDQKNIIIDSKSLPKGIYILRCESQGEAIIKKFIK